jgi:hypothetical protein
LAAVLLALKATLSGQHGGLNHRTLCQVFFALFESIFRTAGMPSHLMANAIV